MNSAEMVVSWIMMFNVHFCGRVRKKEWKYLPFYRNGCHVIISYFLT